MKLINLSLILLIEVSYAFARCPGANWNTCKSYCESQKKTKFLGTSWRMYMDRCTSDYCSCSCRKDSYNNSKFL